MFSSPRQSVHRINLKTRAKLKNLHFSESDIISAIDELKSNAASGPDGFPAIFLKQCKYVLSTPLTIFWKSCFNIDSIPASLKKGIINPVFKSGIRSIPADNRLIALTSHLKVFEKVIRNAVTKFHNVYDYTILRHPWQVSENHKPLVHPSHDVREIG